jgi:dephospho-CoA kinase
LLKVAVTGGIASGKTTVCNHLEKLGYKVFYSDLEAKILLSTNVDLRLTIKDYFGRFSFKENTRYNSSYIANIIFNDSDARTVMNTIMRPFIVEAFERFCEKFEDEPIVFFEGSVIYENTLYVLFNKDICCYTSKAETIRRLKFRNNFTKAQIDSRISSQLPVKTYKYYSDYLVDTSTEKWKITLEVILKDLEDIYKKVIFKE